MKSQTERMQYVDNGDGTVSDLQNGLMWLKQDSWSEMGHLVSWEQSQEYARKKNGERFAGFDDWRVPHSQDAKTLYQAGAINTDKDGCEIHIDAVFAPGSGYTTWTSETRAAKQAMAYDLREDYEFWLDKNNEGFPSSVRLVRDLIDPDAMVVTVQGENGPQKVSRFADNKDGTITDRQAGLMWKKTDSYLELDKWLSWDEARVYIKDLNRNKFAGYQDWRMPTRKEAMSIYAPGYAIKDVYGETVYLPPEFPPGSGITTWTKTLHKTDNTLAIRVFYYNGDFKWHKMGLRSHGIRAVRDAGSQGESE